MVEQHKLIIYPNHPIIPAIDMEILFIWPLTKEVLVEQLIYGRLILMCWR